MPPADEPSVDDTRGRILQVASELFAQRGFHATTTREIADRVGIRQPGLFHHFSSKDEIMQTLQEVDFAASHRAFSTAAALDVSAPVALAAGLLLDVNRLISSPFSFASTLQPAVFNDPAFAAGRARYEQVVEVEYAIVRRGIDTSDFVDVDLELAVGAIEWLIDGMLIDADRRGEAVAGGEWIHTVVLFALRALLRDPAAAEPALADAQAHVDTLSSAPA